MYQHESRHLDNHYEEAPFFREAIALIDNCTQLPKDDRILLRNKIKDYLHSLKDHRLTPNQEDNEPLNELIAILVEANRKKSLAKIQRGDRTMDWVQIKLRKFVDHSKRVKHKRQIDNFRRNKLSSNNNVHSRKDTTKSRHQPQSRNILGASRGVNYLNPSRLTNPGSLSQSREKNQGESNRKRVQNQSYAHYSYHQNFSFLRNHNESSHSKDSRSVLYQQTMRKSKLQREGISNLNRSLDKLSKFNHSIGTSKQRQNSEQIKRANKKTQKKQTIIGDHKEMGLKMSKQIRKVNQQEDQTHDIGKLTKLFSEQLNSAINAQKSAKDKQTTFLSTLNQKEQSSFALDNNDPFKRCEESNKKIQKMLEGSKNLLEEIQSKQQFIPKQITLSGGKSEDLFTPPNFLQQCRKFIQNSNKKQIVEQEWQDPVIPSEVDEGKTLTFNNILSGSNHNQPSFPYLGQMTLNETVSQNASLNISTKKPESQVQFRFKSPSIQNAEQLLLQIFKVSPCLSLDHYQIGQLMSKCDNETQNLLQQYCKILEAEAYGSSSFQLNFVAMLKFLYTHGQVFREQDNHFSNFLTSVLDMKKNGFITRQDVDDFIESMEGSGIEAETMTDIRTLLKGVFKDGCEAEGSGAVATRWGIFYLQLRKDKQLLSLQEQLGHFEFQVEDE